VPARSASRSRRRNRRRRAETVRDRPSGTDYEWKAAAIGGDRDTIQGYLEEHYREDLDVDGGIELAVSALSEPEDGVVNAEDVDVATITTEDESFHSVDTDHLESILAEIDETEEESDE